MYQEKFLALHISYKIKFQKKLDTFPASWAYRVKFRADGLDMGQLASFESRS
jgi:hypothetical protein